MLSSFVIILVCICIVYTHTFALHTHSSSSHRFSSPSSSRLTRSMYMKTHDTDVCILGGGIAGTTIAALLTSKHKVNVCLVDPAGESEESWYPNYGEWSCEWQYLSSSAGLDIPEIAQCITNEWPSTEVWFGGSNGVSMDTKTELDIPYIRVDRGKLQSLLRNKIKESATNSEIIASKCIANRIGPNLFDHNIIHNKDGSIVTLDNGDIINCKFIIDSTGFESRLIERESPQYARNTHNEANIGYQIAYGLGAHVTNTGPYNENAMTLFDYRTDHLEGEGGSIDKDAQRKPTFMYVMPLEKYDDNTYRVFFEETSLVGKGERRLSFAECRERTQKRLAFHNIEILGIEEEEYCYIPMGGELPSSSQRIIAYGGSANMVHPSTGYQACRMMASGPAIASLISQALTTTSTTTSTTTTTSNPSTTTNPSTVLDLDLEVERIYKQALWPNKARLQRDFQVYGGDFLMEQPVSILRGFFTAFFELPVDQWHGFLAGYPGLPDNHYHESWDKRLSFAFQLFLEMPTAVRLAMVQYAITYTFNNGPNGLLRSLFPPFLGLGTGPSQALSRGAGTSLSDAQYIKGDVEVKDEARSFIKSFKKSGRFEPSIADSSNAAQLMDTQGGGSPAPFSE